MRPRCIHDLASFMAEKAAIYEVVASGLFN